jgi:Acetoacetate decarboxylase (ADC)
LDIPIRYRDGSLLVVGYRVDPALASAIVHDKPLEPFLAFGKALVMLGVFEYRDTTIGPYNEIGIGIYAKRRGTSPSLFRVATNMRKCEDIGLYVACLPVTTQAALNAGVELWGFPKYIADIKTMFMPDSVEATLEREFVLTHSRGVGLATNGIPFITYTFIGNSLLRTIIDVGHRVRFGGARSVRLKVIGSGSSAAIITKLGLDATPASFAFRTDSLSAVLPLGKELVQRLA